MNLKHRLFFIGALLFATCSLLIYSCTKTIDENVVPHNPYDDIHRGDTTAYGIPLDSLTIAYVHKKVLSTRCALPGCHVGNFEPDFRTPQSSFSTLVYALINKNNVANQFKYRVIPNDTNRSVLYERITNCCFVTTDDRMPQDGIGVPLPDSSINLIASWIMHGARDITGNVMTEPDAEPVVSPLYMAISTNLQTVFNDSAHRMEPGIFYSPFVVPLDTLLFYVGVKASDDKTAMNQFQNYYSKLKISTKEDDFTSASSYVANYVSYGADAYLVATIPASLLPANDTLFMRYYVSDGHHPNNTEFPRTETVFYYKRFWSFIRQ